MKCCMEESSALLLLAELTTSIISRCCLWILLLWRVAFVFCLPRATCIFADFYLWTNSSCQQAWCSSHLICLWSMTAHSVWIMQRLISLFSSVPDQVLIIPLWWHNFLLACPPSFSVPRSIHAVPPPKLKTVFGYNFSLSLFILVMFDYLLKVCLSSLFLPQPSPF